MGRLIPIIILFSLVLLNNPYSYGSATLHTEAGDASAINTLSAQLSAQSDSTLRVSKPVWKDYVFRGFIGASLGLSIPVGDYKDAVGGPGFSLGALDFGYRFSDNFGLTASGFFSINDASFAAFTVGPLIPLPINDRFDVDVRPMAGILLSDYAGRSELQKAAFVFKGNILFRYHWYGPLSLQVNADYIYSQQSYHLGYYGNLLVKTSVVSANVGLAFRI